MFPSLHYALPVISAIFLVSCSIKGQVLTIDCFGNNATCSNPNPSVICDVPQCACPKGQVIDEAKSACIDGAKCRKYYVTMN